MYQRVILSLIFIFSVANCKEVCDITACQALDVIKIDFTTIDEVDDVKYNLQKLERRVRSLEQPGKLLFLIKI